MCREHCAGCLGRRQPALQLRLHPAHAPLILGGVEPKPAGRAHRMQQAVAPLPCPQAVGAHAYTAAELPDPHKGAGVRATVLRFGQPIRRRT